MRGVIVDTQRVGLRGADTRAHDGVEERLLPKRADDVWDAGRMHERDAIDHGAEQGTATVTAAHEERVLLVRQFLVMRKELIC